jgi:hypothetical protein
MEGLIFCTWYNNPFIVYTNSFWLNFIFTLYDKEDMGFYMEGSAFLFCVQCVAGYRIQVCTGAGYHTHGAALY